MQKLFSPWRSKYIESFSSQNSGNEECIFCSAIQENNDDKRLVVTRGKTCFVVMNLFPYNSGHVMIVPHRHLPDFIDLTEKEMVEIMQLTKKMIIALRKVSKPDGFNIGTNIGRTAGAGIDQHVHIHVVPRWNGDTNFMPVLADTKMISEDIKKTLHKLRKALSKK
jgi:ATP adenylyltransferase